MFGFWKRDPRPFLCDQLTQNVEDVSMLVVEVVAAVVVLVLVLVGRRS
jgi:hypothetical protein